MFLYGTINVFIRNYFALLLHTVLYLHRNIQPCCHILYCIYTEIVCLVATFCFVLIRNYLAGPLHFAFLPYTVLYLYGLLANGPGDLGSIPGRVIPKTQKMVLDSSLLNTQYYKVRIKGKVEQSGEGVALFPTPWCGSYRKGSLWVNLDYGRQLTFVYTVRTFLYRNTKVKVRSPDGAQNTSTL